MSAADTTAFHRWVDGQPWPTQEQLAKVRAEYAVEVERTLAELAARGITVAMLVEVHEIARRDRRAGWARAIAIGLQPDGELIGPLEGPCTRQRTIEIVAVGGFRHLVICEPEGVDDAR